MTPNLLYLLADSQLLFWRNLSDRGTLLLEPLRHGGPSLRAAYIGASNGDAPEYYEIFEAAMAAVGVTGCRMIRSAFTPDDDAFLARADVILLAGGDVERGWTVIRQTGMRDRIVERYRAGATLVGVSAGAVQLGLYGVSERQDASPEPFETLQLCPFVVGAHDEGANWRGLSDLVRSLDGGARGVGIRSGAGVIAHSDGTIEAVRYPADEIVWQNGAIARRILPVATSRRC